MAFNYLQQMKHENIPCNRLSYNFTIAACAYTSLDNEKKDAFDIAKKVLGMLSNDKVKLDQYTFSILLDAYINLQPYSRMEKGAFDFVKEVFHNACERGLVSDYLLQRMRKILDPKDYNSLVPRIIPRRWYGKKSLKSSKI